MRLQGKICAITGAGGGIGYEAAKLFASEGAKVYILERNLETGCATEAEIRANGGDATFIQTDVSSIESVENAFKAIADVGNGLDVLYNNAGVFLGGVDNAVTQLSYETWHKVLDINLDGVFYCCKNAIPLMVKKGGGSVISTTSSAAIQGVPKCDAYTATKGAIRALTRSMATEYGTMGIRVNCIAPCAIATPMVIQSNFNDKTFDEERFLTTGAPLHRWGTPLEVAQVALWLASDDSSYVTGEQITCDGAITINYPFTQGPTKEEVLGDA